MPRNGWGAARRRPSRPPADSPNQRVATSPAVGYYAPRDGIAVGRHVRAGDLLGSVDVLGVRQAVVAPVDGAVGRLYAAAGEAVEYGQRLVRVDGIDRTGGARPAEQEPLSAGRSAAAVAPASKRRPRAGADTASPGAARR